MRKWYDIRKKKEFQRVSVDVIVSDMLWKLTHKHGHDTFVIKTLGAANERYRLWREKISRVQSKPSIILCTPINLKRILLM